MVKLIIIHGPNLGSSFALKEGENWIGRQVGNTVVLSSSQVSKQHCVVLVLKDRIVIRDYRSANGTFVNGMLIRETTLKNGDRVGVGRFVLEVVHNQDGSSQALALSGLDSGAMAVPGAGVGLPGVSGPDTPGPAEMQGPPKNLMGKLWFYFEYRLMPVFYAWNLKYEWKFLGLGVFFAFLVFNVVASVQPVVESSDRAIRRELAKKAMVIARQIVDQNSLALQAGAESKTTISESYRLDSSVKLTMITDLDMRVISPAAKANQIFTGSRESVFAYETAKRYRDGKFPDGLNNQMHNLEQLISIAVSGGSVVATVPVMVLDPKKGKNTAVAMAIVVVDNRLSNMDSGLLALLYSNSFLWTALLGLLALLVIYRLTLKPLEIMAEDLDSVLKGQRSDIRKEYLFPELDELWDLVNSAIQRIPGGMEDVQKKEDQDVPVAEFAQGPFVMIAKAMKLALVLTDSQKRVMYMSPAFEELTGIHSEDATGRQLEDLVRDEALASLCKDLFERSQPGGDSLNEGFEFSGNPYQVWVGALGRFGTAPYGHLLVCTRTED